MSIGLVFLALFGAVIAWVFLQSARAGKPVVSEEELRARSSAVRSRIGMVVDGDKAPIGGRIENDDDTRAAVGDWIEIERAEIRQLAPAG